MSTIDTFIKNISALTPIEWFFIFLIYYSFTFSIIILLSVQGAENPNINKNKKNPRNSLCECGSGKKFKRCCYKIDKLAHSVSVNNSQAKYDYNNIYLFVKNLFQKYLILKIIYFPLFFLLKFKITQHIFFKLL
jgi:hypothetical protein